MQNPHLADAFAALQALSADPEARELAWRRAEAEATTEHELKHAEQKGIEKGAVAMRDAILATARLLEIEVSPAREAALQSLDLAALNTFFQALVQLRAWPS